MAVKHLVVLGVREAESSIDALHVPIDSVVLKTVGRELLWQMDGHL